MHRNMATSDRPGRLKPKVTLTLCTGSQHVPSNNLHDRGVTPVDQARKLPRAQLLSRIARPAKTPAIDAIVHNLQGPDGDLRMTRLSARDVGARSLSQGPDTLRRL